MYLSNTCVVCLVGLNLAEMLWIDFLFGLFGFFCFPSFFKNFSHLLKTFAVFSWICLRVLYYNHQSRVEEKILVGCMQPITSRQAGKQADIYAFICLTRGRQIINGKLFLFFVNKTQQKLQKKKKRNEQWQIITIEKLSLLFFLCSYSFFLFFYNIDRSFFHDRDHVKIKIRQQISTFFSILIFLFFIYYWSCVAAANIILLFFLPSSAVCLWYRV